jgi:hypothetical protein
LEIPNIATMLLTEGHKWCLTGTCKEKLGGEIFVYGEW